MYLGTISPINAQLSITPDLFMCGIAGHVGFDAAPGDQDVASLVQGIRHRGPDDKGLWTSPDGHCVLGQARLAIIDLSPLGHQPMVDTETGNAITFNGEIYNFQALRAECEAMGDVFRSQSDTEVILALYRRHGPECVKKLRGMFAIALWDARDQRLFLARDRLGKKPLNYALTAQGLVFASEIDPLARHQAVARELDPEALELYLQTQSIPAPWTIWKAIRKLPPASWAFYDRSGLRIESYWTVDYRPKVKISEADALDGLEERLAEAVRLRMISDVPLGALLSGGVDSSVVVALMARQSSTPVNTFSIGFREEAFDELPWARLAAEICGTNHHEEMLDEDVEGLLPTIVRHYGEPFADSSALPSFLVSRIARRHVTVALNGDGGDELLGGYPRYRMSMAESLVSGAAAHALSPRNRVALADYVARGLSLPRRIVRRLAMLAAPEIRSINMYGGFWDDDTRPGLMRGLHDPDLLPRWRTEWLAGAVAHADTAFERMLWLDSRTYLPSDLLAKMDIAAMHAGLETRSPLLDHEVIDFCASLPVDMKGGGGVTKRLLKRLAERYFPGDFVHRPKMGFGIPLADWLRGRLRPLVEDVLRDPAAMDPLDVTVSSTAIDDFLTGRGQTASRIWPLLMYGLWRRKAFGDGA